MCGRRPRPMANDVWLPSSVDGVDGQRENQIESSWVDLLTFLFLLWRVAGERGTANKLAIFSRIRVIMYIQYYVLM